MKSTNNIALMSLLAGAVGIGFAPIWVRLSEVDPCATAFYRLLFAQPVLWLWMILEGRRHPEVAQPTTKCEYLKLAAAGFFFALDMGFWHWSIHYTSVANSTLLANAAPIFVTLGAWALFGETITRNFILGLMIAFLGAAFLTGASWSVNPDRLFGDALGVITALFYGSYMLCIKSLRRRFSTAVIMTWSGLVATIVLGGITLLTETSIVPSTAKGWGVLLALAVMSQIAGQSLIAYGMAHLPASFSSVTLLLQPAVAAFLAWTLLGESLSPLQWVGGVIILYGIVLARRASMKKR